MTAAFTFRPVTPGDFERLSDWQSAPHVRRWWPGDDFIEGLEDRLDDPRIAFLIADAEAAPFAFVQHYDIHGWDNHHLGFLPPGARGIDLFVGAAEQTGRGQGSACLAALCTMLEARGAPALGIDPHPDNHMAIRAFEKAGFARHATAETDWGPAVLMAR